MPRTRSRMNSMAKRKRIRDSNTASQVQNSNPPVSPGAAQLGDQEKSSPITTPAKESARPSTVAAEPVGSNPDNRMRSKRHRTVEQVDDDVTASPPNKKSKNNTIGNQEQVVVDLDNDDVVVEITPAPEVIDITETEQEMSKEAFRFERLDKNVVPLYNSERHALLSAPNSYINERALNFIAANVLASELRPSTVWVCDAEYELAAAHFFADESAKAQKKLNATRSFWDPILNSVYCYIPVVSAKHWSLVALTNLASAVNCCRNELSFSSVHCTCDKTAMRAEHMDSLSNSPHSLSTSLGLLQWIAKGVRISELGAKEDSGTESSIFKTLYAHFGDIKPLPCAGQQQLPELSCAWFTVLNARHHVRQLPFTSPFQEQDLTSVIRLVKNAVYVNCYKAGTGDDLREEERPQFAPRHKLFPVDGIKYVGPDCIQALMDGMDRCARESGWDKLHAAPLRSTQEKCRSGMAKAIKKEAAKLKFSEGVNTKNKLGTRLVSRLTPVLLSLRGEGGSAPVFRAMRMHRSSTIVYLNLDIVFAEEVRIGKDLIETPRMWTQFRDMFKESEVYGYNRAKLLHVFEEQARTVLQVLTVHFAAIAEYVLLIAQKCVALQHQQVTRMNELLNEIQLSDVKDPKECFDPKKEWSVEIDILQLSREHQPSRILEHIRCAAEIAVTAIRNGRKNFCARKAISAHRINRGLCDYVKKDDITAVPPDFAVAFAAELMAKVERDFFPRYPSHSETKKAVLHLLNLFRTSVASVEYLREDLESPFSEADVFAYKAVRSKRGRPRVHQDASSSRQKIAHGLTSSLQTVPHASTYSRGNNVTEVGGDSGGGDGDDDDHVDDGATADCCRPTSNFPCEQGSLRQQLEMKKQETLTLQLLSMGTEQITFHRHDTESVFYSAMLELLQPFLENIHLKTNCRDRSGNCNLWKSLRKQFDMDAALYQSQTAATVLDGELSTHRSRYISEKQTVSLLGTAGDIINDQRTVCLLPYGRPDSFGFPEDAMHPRQMNNITLQWRGKVIDVNKLEYVKGSGLGRWRIGNRRGVGPIAVPASRGDTFDYNAVTCHITYLVENDMKLRNSKDAQDRFIRFHRGDFVRLDVNRAGKVVAHLFGFCMSAPNPERKTQKGVVEDHLEITVVLQNKLCNDVHQSGCGGGRRQQQQQQGCRYLQDWILGTNKGERTSSLIIYRLTSASHSVREALHYFMGIQDLLSAPTSLSFLLIQPSLHLQQEITTFRMLCSAIQRSGELKGCMDGDDDNGTRCPSLRYRPIQEVGREVRLAASGKISAFAEKQHLTLTEEQKSVLLPWACYVEGLSMLLGPQGDMSGLSSVFKNMAAPNGMLFSSVTTVVGPPGSGKSSVAVSMMRAVRDMYSKSTLASLRHRRVLVLSCTNNSVDDLMLKYMRTCKAVDSSDLPVRVGKRSCHNSIREREVGALMTSPGGNVTSSSRSRSRDGSRTTRKQVLNRHQFVFATFGSALFEDWLMVHPFEVIIVDEGAYVNEALLAAVLSKLSSSIKWGALGPFIVIIGDHRQLPPFDGGHYSFWRKDAGISHRFFERAVTRLEGVMSNSPTMLQHFPSIPCPLVSLTVQFRMSSAICRLVSENFYDGRLMTGERSPSRKWVTDDMDGKIASSSFPARCATVVDTGDDPTFMEKFSKPGRVNRMEADLIIKLLAMWSQTLEQTLLQGRIAVFTPYKEQVELLKSGLNRSSMNDIDVHVATIDSSQGEEYDIVFLSMVRTTTDYSGNLSFVDNAHQICVALSRAKEKVVVIGKGNLLSNGTKNWGPIIRAIRDRALDSNTSGEHSYFKVKSETGSWNVGFTSSTYKFL